MINSLFLPCHRFITWCKAERSDTAYWMYFYFPNTGKHQLWCTYAQTFSLHMEFTPALPPARDLSLSEAEWLPRSAKPFSSLFFCLKQHILGYFLIIPAFKRNNWCKGEEMTGWTPQENAPTHWMTTFAAFHRAGLKSWAPVPSSYWGSVRRECRGDLKATKWDVGRSCSTETGPTALLLAQCLKYEKLPGVPTGLVAF